MVRAEGLTQHLAQPPEWLGAFAVFATERHCVGRACTLLTQLGRLLEAEPVMSNQNLLEATRRPGRSMGTLARTLEAFLVTEGLAFPLDQAARLAAARRQRRIEAVPSPLRDAVTGFAEALLRSQARARRCGTLARTDGTIESNLAVLRDFARILDTQSGVDDWASVNPTHVESFLAQMPANAPRRSSVLGQFFRWARGNRIVLVDPTRGVAVTRARGFKGPTLTREQQRRLFVRWTRDPKTHPHESLVGVFSLLHAAASIELRNLTIHDIDSSAHTLRLGQRPHPVPLDPTSWTVLQRCLAHRSDQHTQNPHLLVTRATKTRDTPASGAYLAHVLDAAGVRPKLLRSTRLVDLTSSLDPKLIAAAFGLDPASAIAYLADHVDEPRLQRNP